MSGCICTCADRMFPNLCEIVTPTCIWQETADEALVPVDALALTPSLADVDPARHIHDKASRNAAMAQAVAACVDMAAVGKAAGHLKATNREVVTSKICQRGAATWRQAPSQIADDLAVNRAILHRVKTLGSGVALAVLSLSICWKFIDIIIGSHISNKKQKQQTIRNKKQSNN